MLLRGVPRDHSHDDGVTFCESHILVGEVVVGLGERRGDYVRAEDMFDAKLPHHGPGPFEMFVRRTHQVKDATLSIAMPRRGIRIDVQLDICMARYELKIAA